MIVEFGIKRGLLESAVSVRRWFSFPAPELIPVNGTSCSPGLGRMITGASGFKVGGSFTGLTVTTKLALVLAAPSLRVRVMVAAPLASGTVRKVSTPAV